MLSEHWHLDALPQNDCFDVTCKHSIQIYVYYCKEGPHTYRCLNKLWASTSDQFYALKHIDDLDDFNSIHKVRDGDISAWSTCSITNWKEINVSKMKECSTEGLLVAKKSLTN